MHYPECHLPKASGRASFEHWLVAKLACYRAGHESVQCLDHRAFYRHSLPLRYPGKALFLQYAYAMNGTRLSRCPF